MRKLSLVLPVIISALILTGCASATPEPTEEPIINPTSAPIEEPVTPEPTEEPQELVGGYNLIPLSQEEGEQFASLDELMRPTVYPISNQDFAVVLYGSSGCTPTIEKIFSVENGFELLLKEWGDVACTADYAPSTWMITSTANFDWDTMMVWVIDYGIRVELPIDMTAYQG